MVTRSDDRRQTNALSTREDLDLSDFFANLIVVQVSACFIALMSAYFRICVIDGERFQKLSEGKTFTVFRAACKPFSLHWLKHLCEY